MLLIPLTNFESGKSQDLSAINKEAAGGLKEIWERIEPVWKMSDNELVDMMVKRIIYEDGLFFCCIMTDKHVLVAASVERTVL